MTRPRLGRWWAARTAMASRAAPPSLPVAASAEGLPPAAGRTPAGGGAGAAAAAAAAGAAAGAENATVSWVVGPDGTLMVPPGAAVSGFVGSTVKHVVLGTGVTVAPASFNCCDALETVTAGDDAHINKGAFQMCDTLSQVTIGSGARIGKLAFQGCEALTSVTVGARAVFGEKAFFNCAWLRVATVGAGASSDGPLSLPTQPHASCRGGGGDAEAAAVAAAASDDFGALAAAACAKKAQREEKLGEVIEELEAEVAGLRRHLAAALDAARRASLANEDSAFLLKCPITMQIMMEPVTCPSGHTFEREAIETWLLSSRTNPLTREPLTLQVGR